MDKLKENGFLVRYIHPNTLFISWQNWVPSYVRNELKKKTGIVVDEYGRKISEGDTNNSNSIILSSSDLEQGNLDDIVFKTKEPNAKQSNQKKFTPIRSYKPSGNLIYNEDLLNTLEDKLNG
jgi:hypothetical protein